MPFQRVAPFEDLEVGKPVFVDLAEPICVVRLADDSVHAVHDTCSHQEYPLHEGYVDDREVECALHGSTFDLDTGQPQGLPAVKPIPVYACKVEEGEVWVDLDQQRNDAPVPRH